MSASLVGSEMCIRDSRMTAQSQPCPSFKTALSRAPKQNTWWALRTSVPVSYTHLTLPTICSV
eukprot:4005645-Alexandrium_andersonii.AAC.1